MLSLINWLLKLPTVTVSDCLDSQSSMLNVRIDEDFFIYAKALSPAALDIELRSLNHHSVFINALIQRLHSHRDFEAVQAMQNVFLKVHGDFLIDNVEMREDLKRLGEAHRKESQSVLELLASSLGILGFVRSSVVS